MERLVKATAYFGAWSHNHLFNGLKYWPTTSPHDLSSAGSDGPGAVDGQENPSLVRLHPYFSGWARMSSSDEVWLWAGAQVHASVNAAVTNNF